MLHRDVELDRRLTDLMDTLRTWKRETDRGTTIIFIPHSPDEEIVMIVDGEPIQINSTLNPKNLVETAMHIREQPI